MHDEFDVIKLIFNVLLLVLVFATIVGFITNPGTQEEMIKIQKEVEQRKVEGRFFTPDINTEEGWITVDRETGVCYYFQKYMNAGGMTVLVDAEGKPIIWEGNYGTEE